MDLENLPVWLNVFLTFLGPILNQVLGFLIGFVSHDGVGWLIVIVVVVVVICYFAVRTLLGCLSGLLKILLIVVVILSVLVAILFGWKLI